MVGRFKRKEEIEMHTPFPSTIRSAEVSPLRVCVCDCARLQACRPMAKQKREFLTFTSDVRSLLPNSGH